MMQCKYYIIVMNLLWSLPSYGITLNEAFVLAYENSKQLKEAQEIFMGEVEQVPQAVSGFIPKIAAEISQDNQKSTSTDEIVPKGQALQVSNVTRNITLKQNLFNGWSDVAAIKSAQSAFRSSRAKFYSVEQKILLEALDVYMSFYEAKETFNIREASVRFNHKQLEATDERFRLGKATQTDVIQAKAAFAKAESEKATAFANLELAKALFSKTFATDPVNIILPDAPCDLPESLDVLISKVKIANFDVQYVKHAVISSKATALSAKGALLPSVDFNVIFGSSDYNPQSENNWTNSRSLSTSISVKIPILASGGAEYSKIRYANSNARRNVYKLEEVLNATKANAIGSWAGYNAAKSAILYADETVKAYTLALDSINHEYALGSKTVIDVLNTEEELYKAKILSIQTKKQRVTAAYQMKASIGEMTVHALKLPVKYFKPETEFQKVKARIVGF